MGAERTRDDRAGGAPEPSPTGRARQRAAFGLVLALVGLGILVAVLTGTSGGRRTRSPSPPQSVPVAAGTLPACGATCDPIDPGYLTDLHFGATSFWIQPWRAYLDTWPAARVQQALGINFNVPAREAGAVARLLHESGFTLARIGTNWGGLSYANPGAFLHEAELESKLRALRQNGLRPLLILDANSGAPAPARRIVLATVAAAAAGSRTVRLTPASAAEVVPGKSGFDSATFNPGAKLRKLSGQVRPSPGPAAARRAQRRRRRAEARAHGLTPLVLHGDPAILITSVSADGVATLSRPLPTALPAGEFKGTTLLYAPFGSPTLADGSPNPAFQATLRGWLSYVGTVARLGARIFGPAGYDLEVWNELSFGSEFLDAAKYFSPAPEGTSAGVQKEAVKAILNATVAYLRDPAHGVSPQVGITNGFASQTPFPTGAYAVPGLTALSKHPYATLKLLPEEFQAGPARVPYDATGRRDTAGPRHSAGAFTPLFVPHLTELFPEFALTASGPDTIVRDIAPFPTKIYGAPHGRYVAAPGQKPLQLWVTEYNLGFNPSTVPVGPDGVTPETSATVTAADRAHFQAKALLRSLVSMVNKGVAREYFFAAIATGPLGIVGKGFLSAVEAHPGFYPGRAMGGETLTGFSRMLARLEGPGPGPGGARQLRLLSITQKGDHAQFKGDGTAAHPDLYDREVLAVLPFQASPTRFEIPVYVMTRDLLTLYQPGAPSSDVERFDLPDETFRITLGNLPATGPAPAVSAYDPLRNSSTPARIVSDSGGTATIELAATDYPRILTLQYP